MNNITKSYQLISEHLKDKKYKTEMCKNWEKNGTCPYNNKCRFAHGKKEFFSKELEFNPNYKARDCYNFFKLGHCNYGRRCCFRHDERKINEITYVTDLDVLFRLSNPSDSKPRLNVFEQITQGKLEIDIESTFNSPYSEPFDTYYEDFNTKESNESTCSADETEVYSETKFISKNSTDSLGRYSSNSTCISTKDASEESNNSSNEKTKEITYEFEWENEELLFNIEKITSC